MKIAILGWGSLLWDNHLCFDEQHRKWLPKGPGLKLEFSRVSLSRENALTLVIDPVNGSLCNVAYSFSNRSNPDDAICDLRSREGTVLNKIGFCFANGAIKQSFDSNSFESIQVWATGKKIDVVVWTDLQNNFKDKSIYNEMFSVENAVKHIQALSPKGKAKAAEYVWRAPSFISTPLRSVLQGEPWFHNIEKASEKNSNSPGACL
ncbi:MAG: hypothetical protein Q7R35_18010 [Elusimicrobiota bacterium]|nr:hypothetical protein [Elusimicrobiota bacterium]